MHLHYRLYTINLRQQNNMSDLCEDIFFQYEVFFISCAYKKTDIKTNFKNPRLRKFFTNEFKHIKVFRR